MTNASAVSGPKLKQRIEREIKTQIESLSGDDRIILKFRGKGTYCLIDRCLKNMNGELGEKDKNSVREVLRKSLLFSKESSLLGRRLNCYSTVVDFVILLKKEEHTKALEGHKHLGKGTLEAMKVIAETIYRDPKNITSA